MKLTAPALLLIAIAVAGCTANVPSDAVSTAELSYPAEYSSLDDLRGGATSVVLAHVVSSEEIMFLEVPHTRTTMQVDKTLAGEDLDSFVLRQLGGATLVASDGPKTIGKSGTYLLYITDFTFGPDEPSTGEHVIVGPGAWVKRGEGRFEAWLNSKPSVPGLPLSVNQEALDAIAVRK